MKIGDIVGKATVLAEFEGYFKLSDGRAIPKEFEPERYDDLHLPKPDDVLDAIVNDYVATMHAQGIAIGDPERVAIRRAANIQYAWYAAMRRVLG
jgi:hypothetical protein